MELFLVGVNVLLAMLVWRFMLRKTILDHYRDQLFDLRDSLRATYVKNGWDLGSPMYKKLRDLTNGYLRFTEEYSLWQFSFIESGVKKNKDLQNVFKAKLERDFKAAHLPEQEFVQQYRSKALRIMISYMIISSGPLLTLSVLITPFVAISSVLKKLNRGADILYVKASEVRAAYMSLMRFVMAALGQRVFRVDFVEEYSYQQGRS